LFENKMFRCDWLMPFAHGGFALEYAEHPTEPGASPRLTVVKR
jgi:hypothetical protein